MTRPTIATVTCPGAVALWLLAGAGAVAAPPTNNWALAPLSRPALPELPAAAPAVSGGIDRFILARLQAQSLTLAPPADKATLLRRATFDLQGLPPTPAELEAFEADHSPDAFARVVDRLLASPRYGERWARHWLDLARFSESDGFEYDKMREQAWPYRDYLIESFNKDKPYRQFVLEQLAGDALEPITREGIAATGFLVAGPYDEAGNSSASALLKARIREEEMEEIIAAVGQTFLGMTVNCARCHDHKFDPILQRDYYRLKAALEGVRHGTRPWQTEEETRTRTARMDALNAQINQRTTQAAAIEQGVREQLAHTNATAPATPPRAGTSALPQPTARWTFDGNARDSIGSLHGTLLGGAKVSNGRLQLDGRGAFMRTELLAHDLREKTLEAWVNLSDLAQRGGGVISIESKAGDTFDALVFGERVAGKWMAGSGFFLRTRDLDAPEEKAAPPETVHLAVVYDADNRITVYRNGTVYGESYVPTGPKSGLQTYAAGESWLLLGLRHTGAGNGFLAGEIEEARLYDRALSAAEVAASARSAGGRFLTAEDIAAAMTDDQRRERARLFDEVKRLRAEVKTWPGPTTVYAAVSRQPEPTHLLARGDVEQRKEPVTAGGLSAVTTCEFTIAADAPESLRRLKLAEWIVHPENPLTWRVMVNRVWHYHFGHGLVGTPNDFGTNGDRPTHPEMLDWLAVWFRDEAHGSLKQLHRLILTSATYRQASKTVSSSEFRVPGSTSSTTTRNLKPETRNSAKPTRNPKPETQNSPDPDNRLLSHFPLRRLEAEAVRDAMLSVSGQLNPRQGGPGFRPFKVTVSGSHFYELIDSASDDFNRRSIYRMSIQSGKDPLLDSLDCPDPSTKTPARGVTTTPIQSLGLMNNAFVQRQARHLAERLRAEAGPRPADQIQLAYRLALGRNPNPEELSQALELARGHGLESVGWVLLNASEFLYVR